ncbi:MAG TPA: metallophosphoesterase [Pyrinomonadaceae bacterium]|nr:metallophosphoesterase [Pyrinomonadaceae bacterium]
MSTTGTKRTKLSVRISSYVASDKPLRKLAGDLSKRAQSALNEANTLTLERIEITLERLPKKLDGLKCVHLSDIHHSPLTDLKHIERAVKFANRLKPDIVLLTGDYVSHDIEYIAPVAATLANLRSPMGTFACLGNHDHWTDAGLVTELFRGEGITMLVNEGLRLGNADGSSFWLGGVDDHMVGQTDLAAALKGSYPDEVKILLAHNPVIFRQAVKQRVDLTLSGHTHGGQVKLRDKEKRIIRRRKLSSGLHERSSSQIYITRGIGTVVLPVRYQCPPEISLLTLRTA